MSLGSFTDIPVDCAGEVATIELAADVGGVAVLDDRDARRVAHQRGLPLTGTVAILVRLRQLGAIGSLAETLAELDSIGSAPPTNYVPRQTGSCVPRRNSRAAVVHPTVSPR